jgi:hypothetical protein
VTGWFRYSTTRPKWAAELQEIIAIATSARQQRQLIYCPKDSVRERWGWGGAAQPQGEGEGEGELTSLPILVLELPKPPRSHLDVACSCMKYSF